MKKIISLVLSIFAAGFVFASARPSLDGRAVVCDEDEMPKGLFAKTIGYLPGDSVTVTNPANGTTVDVLVLGSIDSSEGIAILLSPEAAERLEIKKNSNVQVKITKRTGSLDENVSGTAVLADEGSSFDYDDSEELEEYTQEYSDPSQSDEQESQSAQNSDAAQNDSENVPAETEITANEENAEPAEEEESVEENSFEAEPLSADAADEEQNEAVEDAESVEVEPAEESEENADDSQIVESEEIPEPAESSEKIEEEPLSEAAENTEQAETPEDELIKETPPAAETENAEKIEETLPPDAKENEDEHFEAEELSDNAEADCEGEKLTDTEPENAVVEDVPAETGETAETEKAEPEIPENSAVPEEAEETEEKVEESAPETVSEGESKVENEEVPLPELGEEKAVVSDGEEEYAPIVLVPSELNPPEEEKAEVEENTEKTELSASEEKAETLAEAGPAPVAEEKEVEEKTAELEKFVKTEKELEKGKYYLQIATLSKKDNVQSIADKYAAKYPLVIIELGSGSYRVMIGPLTADEYGMIKERFVSYGFKDAFLRKIK